MHFNLSSFNYTTALLIFIATVASDILWAFYIRRTNHGEAFAAASFSLFIILLGGFAVTEYVENSLYLIPAGLGAFVGSYTTIWWDSKKQQNKFPFNFLRRFEHH